VEVSREAVLRRRLALLGLAARREDRDAVAAAAPGLRETPAGAHREALAARLGPGPWASAGELLTVWGPRAAPYVVARADLGTFTRGALPEERSAGAFAPSAIKALPPAVAFLDAVGEVEAAMHAAVADGPVERDAMHQRLREALPAALLWTCRACGTDHVHPMVWRTACAMGRIRREDDGGSRAVTYAAVDAPPDPADDAQARRDLTRRALHHHGPLTRRELAGWLAVSPREARGRLEEIAAELEEVDRAGEAALALRSDLDGFAEAPRVVGVRLVGAGDPLLDGRDRASVVPDPVAQGAVWKPIANPGVVLADGAVVGTWRARAKGRRLEVTATPLGSAALPAAERLQPEAEVLAAARGLAGATVA
jgi:hypothetical protein